MEWYKEGYDVDDENYEDYLDFGWDNEPTSRTSIEIDMSKYWQTKDGRILHLCKMEISHLSNCIKLLEKRAEEVWKEELLVCASMDFNGDMACMAQDQFLSFSNWKDYLPPVYYNMKKEIKKRVKL